MSKPPYSAEAAAAEGRETARRIAGLVGARRFDAAREALEALGLSDTQVKRRRVRTRADGPQQLDRAVFICGLHRSGTTLLHDYLCAHYDLSFFQSTKVPENEGQFLQDVFMAERPFGGPGAFAFYPQMQFGPVTPPEAAEKTGKRLLAQWDGWVTGTSPVLLEKSPPNIVRIPYFRSLFPGARFVVWTRDPRAVALSTRKWHKLPVSQLMMHWNAAYMRAFADLGEDCLVVSYEAFCEDPAGIAARIADFCDLAPRDTPLPMAERFARVENANPKYLPDFPAGFRMRNPVRAWELFGYELDSKTNGVPKPERRRTMTEDTPKTPGKGGARKGRKGQRAGAGAKGAGAKAGAQKANAKKAGAKGASIKAAGAGPGKGKAAGKGPGKGPGAGGKGKGKGAGRKGGAKAAPAVLSTPGAELRPMAVQIGFNKCATLSLTRLFNRSGVPSLHCNWSRGVGRKTKPPYQTLIHRNIRDGKPPFDGLDPFRGFFDLELIRPKRHFENFKQFPKIAEAYPNAKFILNTRDKAPWLKSRARHTEGKYLSKYKALYDETEDQVFERWSRDFDAHHAAVRAYFAERPGRLIEFDIGRDDIGTLVDFFAPDFTLDPAHWEHAHKTDDKSWAKGGTDPMGGADFDRFSG